MMIPVKRGYVNSAAIEAVEAVARGKTLLRLRNGETATTGFGQGVVAETCAQIIPATPGFYALDYEFDEFDELIVWRSPVVAWRITHANVQPVAPFDEIYEEEGPRVLLFPDGQVSSMIYGNYPSEEAWRAAVIAKHAEDKTAASKERSAA